MELSPNGNGAAPVATPSAPAAPIQQAAPSPAPVFNPSAPAIPLPTQTGSPAAPVAPSTPTLQVDPIFAGFQALGYDTSGFANGQDMLRAVGSQLDRLPELQQYAELGQQFAPHQTSFQQWLATQVPATPAPAPQTHVAPGASQAEADFAWNMPKPDPNWDTFLVQDEATGLFRGKTSFVPAEMVAAANNFTRQRAEYVQQLIDNPGEVTWKLNQKRIEARAREIVREEIEGIRTAAQHQASARETQQFVEQHKSDLYVLDQAGHPMRDPRTGGEALTPKGQAIYQFAAQAQQLGIQDPNRIREYAFGQYDLHQFRAAQQAAAASQIPGAPAAPFMPAAPAVPMQQIESAAQQVAAISAQQKQTFLQKAALPPGLGNLPNRDAAHEHGVTGPRFNDPNAFLHLAQEIGSRAGIQGLLPQQI